VDHHACMHASPPTPHSSQQAHTYDTGRGLPASLHALTFILCNNNHELARKSERISHPIRIHACTFSGEEATRLDGQAIAAGGAAGDTHLDSGIDACHGRPQVTSKAGNADLVSEEEARGMTAVGTGSHR